MAIQSNREHSSQPDMVNGVDLLQLPHSNCQKEIVSQHDNLLIQQNNECESMQTWDDNQLAIPQNVEQVKM